MRKKSRNLRKALGNQAGMALVSAIFAILLATVIGFALYYSTAVSRTVAINDRDNTEAFYIADAGINHAVKLMSRASIGQFSNILTAGANSTPGTGDELSVPPTSGLWTTAESIPAGNVSNGGITSFGASGSGRYWVKVKNDTATGEIPTVDNNGILLITSTGVGRDGATTTIEAVYGDANALKLPAILVNGGVDFTSNLFVKGAGGILHANGNVKLQGTMCFEQYASTTKLAFNKFVTFSYTGADCDQSALLATYRTSQPVIPVPVYDIPSKFKSQADYVFGVSGSRAGKVYNSAGTQIGTAPWTNSGTTWTYSGSTWSTMGNGTPNGVYYFEGNLSVTGNFSPGPATNRVSFIAAGNMSYTANLDIQPKLNDFSLVSGGSTSITGNFTASKIIYVGTTLGLVSNTTVTNGSLVVANKNNVATPFTTTSNLTITNNNDIFLSSGNVGVINWQEVRY